MPMAGKVRMLYWPAIAAATAITLLFLWSQAHPLGIATNRSAGSLRADARAAGTFALPGPWTLSDAHPGRMAEPANGASSEIRAGVPEWLARPAAGPDALSHAIQPAAPPEQPAARVVLHAPILDPRHEMAGLLAPGSRGGGLRRASHTVSVNSPSSQPSTVAPTSRAAVGGAFSSWPEPIALRRLLGALADDPRAASWAGEMNGAIDQLTALPSLGDRRSAAAIDHLQRLSQRGLEAAETVADRQLQRAWLCAGHAAARRVAVWQSVVRAVDRNPVGRPASSSRPRPTDLTAALAAAREALEESGDAEGWEAFLLLEKIAGARALAAEERSLLAARLLARMSWDQLNEAQDAFLRDPRLEQLAAAVRPWATGPVDYAAVLAQIERQEEQPTDLEGARLAAVVQQLRCAESSDAHQVATRINDHYRNANLRVAVNQDLINRLLPSRQPTKTAIDHQILGTKVRGTSIADTELDVQLLPAEDAWQLAVGASGTARSATASQYGPATFFHGGRTEFSAATRITIDRTGIVIQRPQVTVQSTNHLRSLATEYDSVPVLGPLVRAVALSRHDQQQDDASRQAEALARNQIADSVERQLRDATEQAETQVTDRWLKPLTQLGLRPLVVDLDTTDQRLALRYRIAGPWQLAAFTPRPRAPSDSLLSVQVHQSALNNVLERALATDRPIDLRELVTRFQTLLGGPATIDLDRIPEATKIQFAANGPVVIETNEDRLRLTLRIVGLQADDARPLKHFVVTATYRPEIDGIQARLVREGVLQIRGYRLGMRERLPIRAIFNVVLSDERPLSLTPPRLVDHPAAQDLEVAQLVLRDGWIGMAIGLNRHSLAGAAAQRSSPPQTALHAKPQNRR